MAVVSTEEEQYELTTWLEDFVLSTTQHLQTNPFYIGLSREFGNWIHNY